MTEQWLPVKGYEDSYEVSDRGRVRSKTRRVRSGPDGRTRLVVGRVLVAYAGDVYTKMKLGRFSNTKNVHHLVAEAFLGPRPDGLEVCHNNGQHHDNRAENLRYDTPANNAADRRAHGTAVNQNTGKTHCIHGHEFTPENTYRSDERPGRACRTCALASAARRRAGQKLGADIPGTDENDLLKPFPCWKP